MDQELWRISRRQLLASKVVNGSLSRLSVHLHVSRGNDVTNPRKVGFSWGLNCGDIARFVCRTPRIIPPPSDLIMFNNNLNLQLTIQLSVLYVLPSLVQLIAEVLYLRRRNVITTMAILFNFLNALNLALVFYYRQPDVRSAMLTSFNNFVAPIKNCLYCAIHQVFFPCLTKKTAISFMSGTRD